MRLRPLTRLVSRDDMPKQFCPLLGGRTLLAHTRQRIARGIAEHRTLFALLASHERFFTKELENISLEQMVVQPSNRGTLPAILCSLLQVVRADEQAVIAFFPSDHYYANEANFAAGIEFAFRAAANHPQSVILLGAQATYPETDYGWLETEVAASTRPHTGLLRVKHFFEKPCRELAQDLLDRGCAWNTFVMVGKAHAFLDLIQAGAPRVYEAFEPLRTQRRSCPELIESVYRDLETTDFSKSVLSATPARLGVFCLGDVGWSDLGNPQRLIEVLSQLGVDNEWVACWRQGKSMHATA